MLFSLFGAQALLTSCDVIARKNLKEKDFGKAIKKKWLLLYAGLRIPGVMARLWVVFLLPVGAATAGLSAFSIILSSLIGHFFLKDKITRKEMIAVPLAVLAVILQSL